MSLRDETVLPASFLYVPADRPERFAKAAAVSPAVILDLEDSVALDSKAEGRENVARYLASGAAGAALWVRVSKEFLDLDIAAISGGAAPAGVMVAKADAESLRACADALPGIPLIALIETAAALDSLNDLAQVDSLVTFAVGEVDLLADLRICSTPALSHIIDSLRLEIVRAAAANRLRAPLAPTSLDVRNTDSVASTTAHLRDLGFRSRTAIHPAQCAPIIEAFTPTPDELVGARMILDSLARADGGVAVDANGRFIDAAVVRESEEILSRASGTKARTQ